MDIFRNMDIDMDFSQANAIKYLMRYGKKQGHNRADLMKVLHYALFALYVHDLEVDKRATL